MMKQAWNFPGLFFCYMLENYNYLRVPLKTIFNCLTVHP